MGMAAGRKRKTNKLIQASFDNGGPTLHAVDLLYFGSRPAEGLPLYGLYFTIL